MVFPTIPRKPESVQPGGGVCMRWELAWGRLRRALLRRICPAYVRDMLAKRHGNCARHDADVIDSRDLKYIRNVCDLDFKPADDRFQWRGRLGLARYGLAELIIFTAAFVVASGVVASLAALLHWLFWLGMIPLALVWLEIVYFFRDPERGIPAEEDALVSPADGTITHIEEVEETDFPGERCLRISIFLSIFNVHVNRLPRAGTITQIRYFPGAFLDARDPNSAVRNEQLWIDMREPNGRAIRVKQISGAIARRIVCWLREGEYIAKGERIGMIKLGSRTDLLIPADQIRETCVKVGDKVRGGTTVLLRVLT